MTCPAPSDDRMEATVGRQMSQPRPVPCAPMMSLKLRSPVTRITSNSCARLSSKCSHRAALAVMPLFSSSADISCLTSGRHEPQLVPALVHAFTAPMSLQPSHETDSLTVPAVTLLHEQTVAAS